MKRIATCVAAAGVLIFQLGAAQVPNTPFSVVMTGLELRALPATSIGTERVVNHAWELMGADVGIEYGALLQDPAMITVSGLDYQLPRSTALLAVRKATGGEFGRQGSTHKIFCDKVEERRGRRAKGMSSERARGRYKDTTRLCLVDTDNDRHFDKAFVTGTLFQSDWRLTDIAPIRFNEARHIDLGSGWRMGVRYFSQLGGGGRFSISLSLRNRVVDLSALKLRGATMQVTRAQTNFNAKKLPFRYQIGSAVFVVTAIGENSIKVRQESGFDYVPLDYSLVNRTTIWYMYY